MMRKIEPALICVGIINAPLECARSAVQSQLEATIGKAAFRLDLKTLQWPEFFKQNGRFHDVLHAEIVLFSPREGVTIYVCNLADGWVSLYENVIKSSTFDAFFFRATSEENDEYKIFEMMAWQRGVLVRHIRALQDDDGWKFLNKGDPLPFENVARYKKRAIGARLDHKTLENYSEAAGHNIACVVQYTGECWQFGRSG